MTGLLRRRAQPSDADLNRRRSLGVPDAQGTLAERIAGRNSEQLPRTDSSSGSLDLSIQSSAPPIADASGVEKPAEERPASPPIQDENVKQRRFSMLKFRHASESQLSTRARQQAEAAAAPPMPRRKSNLPVLTQYHNQWTAMSL